MTHEKGNIYKRLRKSNIFDQKFSFRGYNKKRIKQTPIFLDGV